MFAKSQQAIAISNVWIAFGLACVGWQALAINPIECRFVGQIKEFACLLEKPNALANVWMAFCSTKLLWRIWNLRQASNAWARHYIHMFSCG